jgi:hypothetical protein
MPFTAEPRRSGATAGTDMPPCFLSVGKIGISHFVSSFNRTQWEGSSYRCHIYFASRRDERPTVPQRACIPGTRSCRWAAGGWPQFLRAESCSQLGIRLSGQTHADFAYLFGFGAAAGSECIVTPFGIMFAGLLMSIQGFPLVSLLTILPSTIMPHPAMGAVEGSVFGCWADARPDARTIKPGKMITPNRLTLECCFILHLGLVDCLIVAAHAM